MSIDDFKTVEQLSKIVARLTSQAHLRDDLMQEALIHLWQIQELQPGHSKSWYLQSCRFHLQHFLVSGRSVDSHKRRSANVDSTLHGEAQQNPFEIDEFVESDDRILDNVSVRDLIEAMSQRLSARELTVLHCLADGWKTCEIARHLEISHPTVIKHRRKIAATAIKLIGLSEQQAPKPSGRAKRIGPKRNLESILLLAD